MQNSGYPEDIPLLSENLKGISMPLKHASS